MKNLRKSLARASPCRELYAKACGLLVIQRSETRNLHTNHLSPCISTRFRFLSISTRYFIMLREIQVILYFILFYFTLFFPLIHIGANL